MIARVRELSALLTEITEKAGMARRETAALAAAVPVLQEESGHLQAIHSTASAATSALATVSASTRQAASDVLSHVGSISSSVSRAESLVTSGSAAMVSQASKASQSVRESLGEAQRHAELAQGQIATRLDDLQNAVADQANLWNKAVSELIDAVRIGAAPIQQLIALYGDAMVGGQRLREYLKGLDLNFYRNQVLDLITGLREGTVAIDEALQFLGQTQLVFAKQLVDTIELFRRGEVTLKRVAEIVAQIRKAFPDSDLSDLADTLYQALKK